MRILSSTLCMCTIIAACGRAAHCNETRPNILLIVVDDLGWGDVGWHGGFGRTPHLDRLIAESVELDRHYVQPVCTPTRVALMTGRYPSRFGPHAVAPSNLRAMPAGTVTLASALKAAGYRTCQIGKWHLGSRPEWGPRHYGFDHSYGSLTGAADPWTHKYRPGPYENTWHRDGVTIDETGNATELVAAEAVRRIEGLPGPWFVYLALHAVHTPVDAPGEFKQQYEGVRFDDDPARHDSRLRLAAMISQMDAKIGEVSAALERSGQRERTLVVFTSDNGGIESAPNPYVSDLPDSPLNSENAPLRGEKNTLYEGGIRVCAFVSWPGVLAPRKHDGVMHAVDWFPTLAHAAGLEPRNDLAWDGVDQWPALVGTSSPAAPRNIYFATRKGHALRHGDWKLIVNNSEKPQLFNIAADPFEQRDLAGMESQRVAELAKLMAEQRSKDIRTLPADLIGLPK